MAIDNVGSVRLSVEAYLDPKSLRRVEQAVQQHGRSARALGNAYKRPLGEITGQVTEFSKSLDASNARVLAFGASAGAIMGLQRAFSYLLDSMIKVEKELKDINVILGANKTQLQGFSKELFNVAGNTGQSFQTVATAAKELSRQGLSMEKTLLRTRDALILTRLSGMDAESAVASLTAAINTFNRSALNSTQIVNKMANVDAAFAVSTKDLAEAMKRVGSTAQDVQVDFNQLLGAVASLQQTTARGGPVIGNGLKSIFTRIQRTDTLDQLESLGVAVRNLQGEMLPAMTVLGNLAKKFPQLTRAQQAHTAETVAGVFQMNTLRALLSDLSKSHSNYARAVQTSASATNEAIERNEELNKTLDAQIIKLKAHLMQAGKGLGGAVLGPSAQKIVSGLNSMFESGKTMDGEALGVKMAKGMLKGIGSFLAGPGLALVAVIGAKLGAKLFKFISESALEMMNLQTHAMKVAKTEQLISQELSKQPGYLKAVQAGLMTRRQLENSVLQVLQQQAQVAKDIAMFSASTAKSAVVGGGGPVIRGRDAGTFNPGRGRPGGRARGHIPNYNRRGSEIIGAISGGYMPGAIRQTNIAGLGNVTYNTAEKIKHVPGFAQPFINPPQSSSAGKAHKKESIKKLGIDPYSIPNFAAIPIHKQPVMGMQEVLTFLRNTAGKSARPFGIQYMKGGKVHTIGGRQASRENFGIGGKESHSQFDLSGDYKYFRFKKKLSDPGWSEIAVKDIVGLNFDKRKFVIDPASHGTSNPQLRMTHADLKDQLRGGLSGGHIPNFAKMSPVYGSFNMPITSLYGARPVSPTSGGPGASGLYPRYASSSLFSKPSRGSAGQLGENTAAAYSLIGKVLTGFNMKGPLGIDKPGMSLGPGGILGGSAPLANYLSGPVNVNSSAFQALLQANPAKAAAIKSAASGVSTQEFFQRLNTKIKPTSKSSGKFYEDLLFASKNPSIGPRFSGTEANVGRGLDPVEGALRHQGKWFPMDVKSTATIDARGTLGGKAMQSFPEHYRRVVKEIAQWKNQKGLGQFSSNDFRIIDDFFNARSGVQGLKTPIFRQAFDNARSFMGTKGWTTAAGGSIPNFNNPFGLRRTGPVAAPLSDIVRGPSASRGGGSSWSEMGGRNFDTGAWDIKYIKGQGGLRSLFRQLRDAKAAGDPIRTINAGQVVGGKVLTDLLANEKIISLLKKHGVKRLHGEFSSTFVGKAYADAKKKQPNFDKLWNVKKTHDKEWSNEEWMTFSRTFSRGNIPNFVDPIQAAFAREKKASGLSRSQIYATTVDTPNYSGPVVGNTRDEPTYSSLRKAVMNHPNPARAGMSGGFVPNFNPLAMGAMGYGANALGWDAALRDMEKQMATLTEEVKHARTVQNAAGKEASKAHETYKKYQQNMTDLSKVSEGLDKLGTGQVKTQADQMKIINEFKRTYGSFVGQAQYELVSGPRAGTQVTLTQSVVDDTAKRLANMIEGKGGSKTVRNLFRGGWEAADARDQRRISAAEATRDKALSNRRMFRSAGLQGKSLGAITGTGASYNISNIDTEIKRLEGLKGTDARTADINELKRAKQNLLRVDTYQGTAERNIAARQAQVAGVAGTAMSRVGQVYHSPAVLVEQERLKEKRNEKSAAAKEKREIRKSADKDKRELKKQIAQEKSRGAFARNAGMMGQLGMGIGFFAPMVGHSLAAGINQNTKAGRQAASNVRGASSVASFAAMGATMGSVVPGVGTGVGLGVGAALGAAVGAYSWITDYAEQSKSTLDDLRNVYAAEVALKQEAASATGDFVKAQQEYVDAMQSGAGATTLAALRQKGAIALQGLGDPNRIRELAAAASTGDVTGMQDILAKASMAALDEKKIRGEGGVFDKAITIGKDERFSYSQMKTMARNIALHGGGRKGEAMKELKGDPLFENFRDVEFAWEQLEAMVEAEEKLMDVSKEASKDVNQLAGSVIKLKTAAINAANASQGYITISETHFKSSIKNQEAIGKLLYNISHSDMSDRSMAQAQQRNLASLSMQNVAAYQRAGGSLLTQGTRGITSGAGTRGQQAKALLGKLMMQGAPGDHMGLYKEILNDPTVDDKSKTEIRSAMDKLATQINNNTVATYHQNNLLKINNTVAKSNADFQHRMKMQASSFGGQGPAAFFAAAEGFSGGSGHPATFEGMKMLDSRVAAMGALEGMGFDLNRSGLGDSFRQTKKDRFAARGGQMLDFLLGGKHSSAIQKMSLKDAESYLRGEGGAIFGQHGQAAFPMGGNARMADRPISQHGDIAYQILRTMKSGDIDREKKAAETRIRKGQSDLQVELVRAMGANTEITAQLINTNVELINASGLLTHAMSTLPQQLSLQMREINNAYSLNQNRERASSQLGSLLANPDRLNRNLPLAREPMHQTFGRMAAWSQNSDFGVWNQKGTGEEHFLRKPGPFSSAGGQRSRGMYSAVAAPAWQGSGGAGPKGGYDTAFPISRLMRKQREIQEGKIPGYKEQLKIMRNGKPTTITVDAANPQSWMQYLSADPDEKGFHEDSAVYQASPMLQQAMDVSGVQIPAMKAQYRTKHGAFGNPMKNWLHDFRELMSSEDMRKGNIDDAIAKWYDKEGEGDKAGFQKVGVSKEALKKLIMQIYQQEAKYIDPNNPYGGSVWSATPAKNPAFSGGVRKAQTQARTLVNTLTQGGTRGSQQFGPETNVQVLQSHLSHIRDLNQRPDTKGMFQQQENDLGNYIMRQVGGGNWNVASQAIATPGGGTTPSGYKWNPKTRLFELGGKPNTATSPKVSGLVQVGQDASRKAVASGSQMSRDLAIIDSLTKLPKGLEGTDDLRDPNAMKKYYQRTFANLTASRERAIAMGRPMELAMGRDPRDSALQIRSQDAQERLTHISQAMGKIQTTQESREKSLLEMGISQTSIDKVRTGEQKASDAVFHLLSPEQKKALSTFQAGQKQLGALEDVRKGIPAEVEANRKAAYNLEITKMKERASLTEASNGHLALGTTKQGLLNSIKTREIDELMKNIPLLEQDSTKTEELQKAKEDLTKKLQELPIDKFKEETERLSNTLKELNIALDPAQRGELTRQFKLQGDIGEQEANKDLLRLKYQMGEGFDQSLRTQRLSEHQNVLRAEQSLALGTGTGRQLAGARNAQDMSAFRRGEMNFGETLQRQMQNKIKASQTDWKEDLMNDVAQLSQSITSSFESAWDSWIDGSQSGKDAFKSFAKAVAMDMQRVLFRATVGRVIENVIAGSIGAMGGYAGSRWSTFSKGGLVPQRFNTGGMVTGGSGYKDDVPAMMAGGEFVMRKSAVQKYGSSIMEDLNQGNVAMAASGGTLPASLGKNKPLLDLKGGRMFPEVNMDDAPSYTGRSGVPPSMEQGRNRGFKQQLDNFYLMNDPDRPGRAKYQVDKRLSNFALFQDESNVQSQFRKTRQDKFLDYEDFLKMEADRRNEAMQSFQDQRSNVLKAGRLNAVISAAMVEVGKKAAEWRGEINANRAAKAMDSGGAPPNVPITDNQGRTYIPNPNTGGWREVGYVGTGDQFDSTSALMSQRFNEMTFQDARNTGVIDFGWQLPRTKTFAKGGFVKRFGIGGRNVTGGKEVPALLQAGEFVLDPQATQTYGTEFLNRLNKGLVPTFHEGGVVPGGGLFDTAGSAGGDPEKISQLVDLAENMNRLMEESSTKESEKEGETLATGQEGDKAAGSGGMINNISITVNGGRGGGEPTAEVETSGERGAEGSGEKDNEGDTGDLERNEKLADSLRGVVLETIVKEQRPGGLLHEPR